MHLFIFWVKVGEITTLTNSDTIPATISSFVRGFPLVRNWVVQITLPSSPSSEILDPLVRNDVPLASFSADSVPMSVVKTCRDYSNKFEHGPWLI